jgi:uncharacterized membrane protein YhaH (DUF805 family)
MYWAYLFTSLQGRINREPFWIGCAILAVVEIASQLLAYRIEGERLSSIVDLAWTYPEFALAVKRANDRDLPTWVVGLFFAGNIALDLFTLLYGNFDNSDPVNGAMLIPFAILGVILIIELGFRRGSEGPNRYGPDPLGDKV